MTSSMFHSLNPARPADIIDEFPVQGASDVDRLVVAASEAQRSWARLPMPLRAERIAACGELLANRKDEYAALVTREVGKTRVEAGGDVQEAIDMARFIAGQGRSALGTTHASELADKVCWTTRQPVGVVGMITPWNFPVAIPSWKIFPALLAGNGIVLKPSELAPACARAFVDACVDSGIPGGLIGVVHGGAEAGAALATHRGVRAVSFTGSVEVGRRVAASAMESGPRLVALELGGKNAMVVLSDADLDLVVDGVLFGAFGTAGQRCTSTSRLIVHADVADVLLEKIVEGVESLRVGDPVDPAIDVGPVINEAAIERISSNVQQAIEDGARVVSGGGAMSIDGCEDGTFFAPTVLADVRPEHAVARVELFGPVLSVIRTESVERAFEIVNEAEYGLSAAVYTRDVNVAFRAIDAIDTGIVYVNAPTIGAEIHLPFGGTKHTGNGFREAGTLGIQQFSEVKSVFVDYSGTLQRAQIDNRSTFEE